MVITLHCPKCNEGLKFDLSVFRIDGPTIYIDCPFCREKHRRNFVAYLFSQIQGATYGRAGFENAATLISIARKIEKGFK